MEAPPPPEAALYGEPSTQAPEPQLQEPVAKSPPSTPKDVPNVAATRGTIKPFPGFNDTLAETQVKNFKQAFAGFGTDEARIIKILTTHSSEQRQAIKKMYKTCEGEELIEDLKSELSGCFEDACIAMLTPDRTFDAQCLQAAVEGLGTDDESLIEIVCPRTNEEIQEIKKEYRRLYGEEAEDAVADDTSGDYKRLLVSMMQASRAPETDPDMERVKEDTKELYDAGEGKNFGTDESVFNRIFCMRSRRHLNAVFDEYKAQTGKDILESLRDEFSGNIKECLIAIAKFTRDPSDYFAERIHKAITDEDDRTMMRFLVTHSETDLEDIKAKYVNKYHRSLAQTIADNTWGDYKTLLMKIVNPPAQLV